MNRSKSRASNCSAALLFCLALSSAAGPRAAHAEEALRSDTLAVEISDEGSLTDIRRVADRSDASGTGKSRVGAWYRGTERLVIVPASLRRSASHFEADLAGPIRGRLRYSLAGSVLTVEVHGPGESLPSKLRFELPNASVSLEEEDRFVGIASYLNGSRGVRISPEGDLDGFALPHTERESPAGQWIGRKSRYYGALLSAPGAEVSLSEEGTTLEWSEPGATATFQVYLGNPSIADAGMGDVPDGLRYAHLWGAFRYLCFGIEWLLVGLYGILGNWGAAIVATSLSLRVVMLPLNRLVARYQREVNANLALLDPRLQEIKRKYKGGKVHEEILAAHKALGITPFHSIKPTLGLMIQIPILIGVFNVFGELEAVRGHSFLWIEDLSYPDRIARLPVAIPLFGDAINLLPLLMAAVGVVASVTLKPRGLPEASLRSQRRGLYLMAGAFFLLFHPFPASMVLLWTTTNFLQLVQQTITQRKQSAD